MAHPASITQLLQHSDDLRQWYYRVLNNYLYYLGVPFMKGVYTDYYKGYYRGLVYRGLDKYQYYFGGSLLSL